MAFKQSFLIFVIVVVAIILPRMASATEYVVGDNSGWTIKFDYQAWAKDKEFRVGDKLVFKYPMGAHNVFKVNGTAFKDCIVPSKNNDQPLATGNDVITLTTPGNKWYICGVDQHCAVGDQKLAITVLSELQGPSPAPLGPSPISSNSANGIMTFGYKVFVVTLIAVTMIFLV